MTITRTRLHIKFEKYNFASFNATDMDTECPICYCSVDSENILITTCNHIFCISCFKQYMISISTKSNISRTVCCPMCRQKIQNARLSNEYEMKSMRFYNGYDNIIIPVFIEQTPRYMYVYPFREQDDHNNDDQEEDEQNMRVEYYDFNLILLAILRVYENANYLIIGLLIGLLIEVSD